MRKQFNGTPDRQPVACHYCHERPAMPHWWLCRPCWDERFKTAPGELPPANEGPSLASSVPVSVLRSQGPAAADERAVPDLVNKFSRALGWPVCTPEWVANHGRMERAKYRVWRWDCPVCRAGERDPDGIYRPLVIDSDGRVGCNACNGSVDAIAAEVGVAFDRQLILENLGLAA